MDGNEYDQGFIDGAEVAQMAAARKLRKLLPTPPVALLLKVQGRGGDTWVEDANGVEVIARTCGFKNNEAHVAWCRWVARVANAALKGYDEGGVP